MFEMISLLGFNVEFIKSLQVYGLLQNIIDSLKSDTTSTSIPALAPTTQPGTGVGKFSVPDTVLCRWNVRVGRTKVLKYKKTIFLCFIPFKEYSELQEKVFSRPAPSTLLLKMLQYLSDV
jgi:hypothetical protein